MIASAIPHLLYVHHDKESPSRLAVLLEDIYYLFTARSERNAEVILEAQDIQLVLVDATQGAIFDGTALCGKLKSCLRFAHIPVVLMISAFDMPARMACLECGADSWIEKPFSREYLRALIRNLLANRARLQGHYWQSMIARQHLVVPTGEKDVFLRRLTGIISDHLPDADLNVELLASMMNMSRPTLYRRIKSITDLTPNDLINVVRLEKAAGLLCCGEHKVFEIVKMVGFNSRSNFGKAFHRHFGVSPKEYQQMTKSVGVLS